MKGRRGLLFIVLICLVFAFTGCANAKYAKYYKTQFLKQADYKGTELEKWIKSCDGTGGYYLSIVSDPDSWEMAVYYPNINPDLKKVDYKANLEVKDGTIKVFLTESEAASDSDVVKDLVLHIDAPRSGSWPSKYEVYVDGQKAECLGSRESY